MGLFGKKSEYLHLPGSGRAVPLEEVPDPLFAGRTLGDGFGFESTDGRFLSPVDGEVVTVAETRHAVGLRTRSGAEVLLHIGVDTVALKGDGFEPHVRVGDTVKAGDPLVSVDLPAVSARVPSMISPVILLNGDSFRIEGIELAGNPVAMIRAR